MRSEATQFGVIAGIAGVVVLIGLGLGGEMFELFVSIAMLIGGLYLLVKGADVLVHGAVRLARLVGVSPFFIGVTVVAFGTSAPELAASVGATLEGQGDLAIGNVIGSNIANICLILGVSALIKPIPVDRGIARVDTPIMIVASLLAVIPLLDALFGSDTPRVSRLDGALLVLGLVAYVAYNAATGRVEVDQIETKVEIGLNETPETKAAKSTRVKEIASDVVLVLLGLVGLVVGAKLLVGGAVDIAERLSVPSVIIGLSVVAIGTSVPELAFSIRAALKGHPEIALGNVVGSNVFNLLCVVGIAALVRPIPVPSEAVTRDLWVMLGVTVLIWPLMLTRQKINRLEGGVMLAAYCGYIAWVYVVR